MPKISNLRRLPTRLRNRILGSVKAVNTSEPVIALTFDDGPHPEYTPRLLDILQRHDAHATFFMVGESAQQYPHLVQRVAEAGHTIGNHGWDHASFPLLTGAQRREQMRRCERALAPYGERVFRPPYGHQNRASRLDALLLGYQVIAWNSMAHDWLDHDADTMLDAIKDGLKPGAIVLLHDTLHTMLEPHFGDRDAAFETVDRLLTEFKDHYRFVNIMELLNAGRALKQPWYRQPDAEWIARLA